jgi:hypothetical protein
MVMGSFPQLVPQTFPGGPRNMPSQFNCDAERMVLAGGALASHLLAPEIVPLERVFRKAPETGIYTASRQKPCSMVLGAFSVPKEYVLALCQTVLQPYRFDGVATGDAVPVENRRLALSLAYDLTVGTTGRPGNLQAELIPGAPGILKTLPFPSMNAGFGFPSMPSRSPNGEGTFVSSPYGTTLAPGFTNNLGPTGPDPSQFVMAAAGAGALMPQTQDDKQGPSDMPFTYYINENDSVSLSVVAFGPVKIPLAFIEATLTGYLVPKTSLTAMLEKMRPCST